MLHYCAFSLVRFLFVAGFVRLAVVLVESPVSDYFHLFVYLKFQCVYSCLTLSPVDSPG